MLEEQYSFEFQDLDPSIRIMDPVPKQKFECFLNFSWSFKDIYCFVHCQPYIFANMKVIFFLLC